MITFLKRQKGRGSNRRLDELLQELQMNLSNNYKDAAQQSLREFEAEFKVKKDAGELTDKQLAYYEERLAEYREKLKNFTHKDQKPFWT